MGKITDLRNSQNMTQAELSKITGLSQSYINMLENGQRGLNYKTIAKLAKAFKLNPEDIISNNSLDVIKIDMLDVVACCGNGIETYTENVVGQWSMPITDFKQITSTTPDNIKLIAVKGDSMQPTIKEGDFCFVDISKRQPDSDGMFLLRIATGLAVKRIQGGLTNNLIIKSDNPKYDNLTAAVGEVSVLGKVIYILKAEKVG